MEHNGINGFRPIYVARFLAVSRLCLFVNFANLATIGLKGNPVHKRLGNSDFAPFLPTRPLAFKIQKPSPPSHFLASGL